MFRSTRLTIAILCLAIFIFTQSNQTFAATVATCNVPSTAHATIQAAVDDVACDQIDVAAGIYYENISIGRDVIINGALDGSGDPDVIVDGQQVDRVFTINSTPQINVTLRGLVIRHGDAGTGGGIDVRGQTELLIDNVVLTGNSAGQGGGLYLFGGNVQMLNSFVTHNTATWGGGINGEAGGLTLDNVGMYQNSAETGGALSLSGSLQTFNVMNSQISHNTATYSGGGLGTAIVGTFMTISNTHFNANEAGASGGAIFAWGPLTLNTVSFLDNKAKLGGGVAASNYFLGVTNSFFRWNEAAEKGGAIYAINSDLSIDGGTRIHENKTSGDGGGVYARGDMSLTVKETSFFSNMAMGNGGGMYIENIISAQPPTLEEVTFTRNNAGTDGGGVWMRAESTQLTPLNIIGGSYTSNRANEGSGGAIFGGGNIDMSLANVDVVSNSAKFASGVQLVQYGAQDGELKIEGGTFDYNAGGSGPIFTGGIHKLTVNNAFVRHNTSEHTGGIFAGGVEEVALTNSVVTHNSANVGNGGGIELQASINVTLDGLYIAENTAAGNGGGIHTSAIFPVIKNSTIYKNNATTGGGIAVETGFVDISTVAIDNNTATENGGGIAYLRQVNANLTKASVTNNSAENGAGIYINAVNYPPIVPPNFDNFQISEILVGYNEASQAGGGIYIASTNEVDVAIDKSAVYRNDAVTGGGIFHEGSLLAMSNSSISENSATNLGSGIYGDGAFTTFYMTIADNTESAAIHKVASAETFALEFSIIHNPAVDNCAGDISSINVFHILDSDGTCSTVRTALTGIDPMLAPLADNGNNQMSHALLPGSPALGEGTNCPQFDQHGVGRPANHCDIGAFQTPLVPTAVTLSSTATQSMRVDNSMFIALFTLAILSGFALLRRETQHNM